MSLEVFQAAYIEAMLWSETDNANDQGGEPLDKNYCVADFDSEALARIKDDCKAFHDANAEKWAHIHASDLCRGPHSTSEQAGHDFWLTRQGHGAGFWDGDWPYELGQELTGACKAFGECYVSVDDGKLYIN